MGDIVAAAWRMLADYAVKMLPGILAAALAYGLLLPRRRRSLASACLLSSRAREAAMLVFWAFCGGMAILTLTPDWFDWRSILAGGVHMPFFMWGTVNLRPFGSYWGTLWSALIVLANVVMFLPFGFFPALLWRNDTWWKALLAGFAVTLFIECCQLCVGRAFDVDDLLLNTTGAMLGYWLWLLLRKMAPRFTARFQVVSLPPPGGGPAVDNRCV